VGQGEAVISRGARARDGIDVLLNILNSNTNRSWAAIPTLGKNVIIQRVRITHYSWAYGPDSMCLATQAQERHYEALQKQQEPEGNEMEYSETKGYLPSREFPF